MDKSDIDIVKNAIENFINEFKKDDDKLYLTDKFLNGYCYHFAIILKSLFPCVSLTYIPVLNHFCVEYEGTFYDITGKITNPKIIELAEPWISFIVNDPLETNRIIHDCIYKSNYYPSEE